MDNKSEIKQKMRFEKVEKPLINANYIVTYKNNNLMCIYAVLYIVDTSV